MEKQDKIKELFSEKLGNYSAPVKPELWTSIASKIAVDTAVVTSGTSLLVKGLITISAASVIAVVSYFAFTSETTEKNQVVESKPLTEKETVNQSVEEESTTKESSKEEIVSTPSELENKVSKETKKTQKDTELELEENPSILHPVYVPKVRKTDENPESLVDLKEIKKNNPIIEEDKGKSNKQPNSTPKEVIVYSAEITLMPNSFTPNGDGVNDEFYIEFKGKLLDFNIVILDQSNRTVFESKDPNFRWSGIDRQGLNAPVGTYYYLVTAVDSKNNPINKYSPLSVER